jgi:hypothetical protein
MTDHSALTTVETWNYINTSEVLQNS